MNFSISDHDIGGHIFLLTSRPISNTNNGKRYGIVCKIILGVMDHYNNAIYCNPEDFAEYKDVIKVLFNLAHNKSIRKINLNF